MTQEQKGEEGVIVHIYSGKRDHLVGRGLDAKGSGFSNRKIELDENMQPIVRLDDGTIARPQKPKDGDN